MTIFSKFWLNLIIFGIIFQYLALFGAMGPKKADEKKKAEHVQLNPTHEDFDPDERVAITTMRCGRDACSDGEEFEYGSSAWDSDFDVDERRFGPPYVCTSSESEGKEYEAVPERAMRARTVQIDRHMKNLGKCQVFDKGYEKGCEKGYAKGHAKGQKGGEKKRKAFIKGQEKGYEDGYTMGKADGFYKGYESGKADAFAVGAAGSAGAVGSAEVEHLL